MSKIKNFRERRFIKYFGKLHDRILTEYKKKKMLDCMGVKTHTSRFFAENLIEADKGNMRALNRVEKMAEISPEFFDDKEAVICVVNVLSSDETKDRLLDIMRKTARTRKHASNVERKHRVMGGYGYHGGSSRIIRIVEL